MDRDSKTDVAVFIRDHEDKIQQDIEKMVEYGDLIYEGKTPKDMKRDVAVTMNGFWVVIWDPNELTVITLYRIDLGVGDDVNQAFIKGAYDRIKQAQNEYEETVARTNAQIDTYKTVIEDSEASLARYRKMVKDIEKQISGCREMIQCITTENEIARDKLVDAVETLIGKQKF